MTFVDGLREHLSTIESRDLARFSATVSRDPAVCVVGPDGAALRGYAAIVAAHAGWFAGAAAWTFAPQIVLQRESESLGFAVLDVLYREGESERRFWLSLVFVKENGVWKLLYDQNTPASVAGASAGGAQP